MIKRKLLGALTLASLLLSGGASASIDVTDLEAFLDGIIQARMESFGVAGTTISVVHEGEMILAQAAMAAALRRGSPHA